MRKGLVLWFLMLLMLSGCAARHETVYRVVTGVEVTVSHNAQVHTYRYTQPEKMSKVLNYLRSLRTYAPAPIAADTFRGDAFRIILERSDGTQVIYHQIADGYLQKDGGPWEATDEKHAANLLRLLQNLSPDG